MLWPVLWKLLVTLVSARHFQVHLGILNEPFESVSKSEKDSSCEMHFHLCNSVAETIAFSSFRTCDMLVPWEVCLRVDSPVVFVLTTWFRSSSGHDHLTRQTGLVIVLVESC
jgi:hypothetical protein